MVIVVPPQFLSLLENKTVQVSTNHMFVCAASGDPRLVFTWRFNEEKIDNTGPKYSIASNTTVSILVISDVTGLDEGVYKCSVSNRFGQEATSAYLTVQGKHLLYIQLYTYVKTCNCTYYMYMYTYISHTIHIDLHVPCYV